MNALITTFLIPLLASTLSIFLRGKWLTIFNLSAALITLFSAYLLMLNVAENGAVSIAFGGWLLPFGIEFYADSLSSILVILIALVLIVVLIFLSFWENLQSQYKYYALVQALITSTIAISYSADLFNLYVWFELMLIAILGLMVLEAKKWQIEAALKYFAVSMLGTFLMLAAIGLIYGLTGHLNFTAVQQAASQLESTGYFSVVSGLLIVALLLKVGAFPLFVWLPAAYHTLPGPLLALTGGLLTKIAVYVMLRLSHDVLDMELFYQALGWLAVVTMISGVLGAAFHWDLRRILAFHIVSQIGFLLLGIALATPMGLTGTAFFLFHNIVVKTNLLLIAALIFMLAGHYDLRKVGGLFPAYPVIALMFLLSAFSLVGVPLTSGFWGKLIIIKETFLLEYYLWGAAALFTGFLTLYSMTKIWLECFWKPHPNEMVRVTIPLPMNLAILLLSTVVLFLGVLPETLIDYLYDFFSAK